MRTYEQLLGAMQERYKALAGFEADGASDIGIRLKVLAQQAYSVLLDMQELKKQVFVQTSTGDYLEMHAQTRGLNRKGALPAQGVLRFYRESPAQGDIVIAKGILCATRPDPQVQFETTEAAVLPTGETAVEVSAQAVGLGAQGNAAGGSICLMVTPAPGISGVFNPGAFAGGVDAEGDEALRERLLSSFANISNGTNCAYYYDLAMQHDGVASANVMPRQRGRGTVDVIVACHNQAAEEGIVAQLQQTMQAAKEINVDVMVKSAMRHAMVIQAQVAVAEGCAGEAVLEACTRSITGYMESMVVGQPLLLAHLTNVLMGVDGVDNCRIVRPSADAAPLGTHLLQAGSVRITQMEG